MPRLLYPFLAYRSVIVPFLLVSAVAVPAWLVIRLARRRTSAQRPTFLREMLLGAFVLYLSGLAAATLAPERGARARARHDATGGLVLRPDASTLVCPSSTPDARPNDRFFCGYNAKGNVLLFFPLGVLLALLWPRLRVVRGMLIALALSVSIEVIQYVSSAWGSYRMADVNDVILNVIGASLGLALVALLRRLLRGGSRPVRA
jgi:VanZ family protein